MRSQVMAAAAVALLAAPALVTAPAQADTVVARAKLERNIERGLKQQAKVKATAKCPDKVRWVRGKRFYCSAKTAQGDKVRIQVTLGSVSKGKLRWKVVA